MSHRVKPPAPAASAPPATTPLLMRNFRLVMASTVDLLQLTVYSGLASPRARSWRGAPAAGVSTARVRSVQASTASSRARPSSLSFALPVEMGASASGPAAAASAAARRSRACSDDVVSQAPPDGQPPTLGGR